MNTLTIEAPETTEVETPIQTLYQSTVLTLEDQTGRQQAHEATKTRFQQVVFASPFAGIARRVRKGDLTPQPGWEWRTTWRTVTKTDWAEMERPTPLAPLRYKEVKAK